jgi:FKBP-type peptidyl-prolyl cis-trans isomerase
MFLKSVVVAALYFSAVCAMDSTLYQQVGECPASERNYTVARAIWWGLADSDPGYVDGLIEGMTAADRGIETRTRQELVGGLVTYFETKQRHHACRNLEASDLFFSEVDGGDWTCLLTERIYCRKLERGDGAVLPADAETVELFYSVKTVEGTAQIQSVYADNFANPMPQLHGVSDLIPGLVEGLQGMRVGESRELLVHPDVAYGCDSRLEPGVALRIRVKLIAFGGSGRITPPAPASERPSPVSVEELNELAFRAGYAEGVVSWRHFRQAGDLVMLEGVVEEIRSIQAEPERLGRGSEPADLLLHLQATIAFQQEFE